MMSRTNLNMLIRKAFTAVAALSILLLSACGDDEPSIEPVAVSFAQASLSITENGGEQTISISLSEDSKAAGSFDIQLTGATYTDDYTTSPDGASGTVTISIAEGSSFASFAITPTNNDELDGDKVVTLTLANPIDGIVLGTQTTLTVTITDDEVEDVTTDISAIRALFTEEDVEITEETFISGTVISTTDATNSQNIVLQDETAGIVIRFTEDHTFVRGDELLVTLTGGSISQFNNLVQIVNLEVASAVKEADGMLPTPKAITIEQANSGTFESQLVTIENVYFVEADGSNTLDGNNTLTDGTGELIIRITADSFSDNVIPFGTGSVSGLMGVFRDDAQLLPQAADEIFANDPTTTLTLGGMLDDFGSVNTNMTSATQTLTIEGAGLLADISIVAPSNFEISTSSDTDFSGELTIPQATSGATTIYARFAPTSGVSGMKTGEIVFTTLQATTVRMPVAGMEVSTSNTTLLFEENFDYGTTEGLFVNDGMGIGTDNWEAHSGAGSSPANYVTSNLSLTDYPSSDIGGSVLRAAVSGSIEDINRNFDAVSSGKVYAAALINVSGSASTGDNGDYFMHFKAQDEFNFYSRVILKDDGAGNLLFGIREKSGTTDISTTNYSYNTTYLVVMTYDFDNGNSELYVLDSVPSTEPMTPTAQSGDDATDAAMLNEFAIRGDSDNPSVTIDGVRVALDWDSLIGAN